jgi:hypothetical protein
MTDTTHGTLEEPWEQISLVVPILAGTTGLIIRAKIGWNIIKTSGTNIIGGPYLGGNYWADYTGEDWNRDGLGDTRPYYSPNVVYPPYGIKHGADYLPLVLCTSPP